MNFSTYQYLIRYSIFKPGALNAYRTALQNQLLSDEELTDLSWKRTKKLLHYASENVPWYKKRYATIGLNPLDITQPEHFLQVPVLKRQEIIDNYDQFISQKVNPETLKISTTGGSTGTPLKVGMQKNVIRELQKWQMLSWWGISPNANMATIYREVPQNKMRKIALNFIRWPQKIISMDATQITSGKIMEFIADLNQTKPELIHGYVGALDAISDYVLQNNITLPSPKVVWATAAPINAIQEKKISQAFNAPVYDQYGCSEIYFISAECKHKEGLHIFADAVKVEILNNQNKLAQTNEYGRIILTNLNDYHFPLIRYENGDRGRILNKKCSCGMGLPLMDKVKGRITDNIVLSDGTILSGEYLTTIFDDFTDSVKQFQIVHLKNKTILVRIVLKNETSQNSVEMWVKNELGKKVNNQVDISIRFVEKIQPINGKLRFIIQE